MNKSSSEGTENMSYKRIIISKFGGPEVLKVVHEKQLPEPKAGEVRVKVLKTGANFTDVMIRKGKYPDVKQKPPFSPGYDMVGIVDKCGDGAAKFQPGQRVADMTVIGSYSEYICLPDENLTPVPDEVNSSDALSLILSYMTAWQMLHRVAKVQSGQSVLVHGAAGAVGVAMLQLGILHGLKMYGTASSAKHDLIYAHGATPIDYKNEDFVKIIQNQNGGIDAVFDPIGGSNFKRSFKTLNPGGKLVAFGFYNSVMGKGGNIPIEFLKLKLWNILPNRRSKSFYSIGGWRKKHPEWFREDLHRLFNLLREGKINPVISEHFPLEKAAEVHQKIENAELKGKVIFDVA